MSVLDRITTFLNRVASYAWWEVITEIALIALVLYLIIRFVSGTRAAGALKGLLVVLVLVTVLSRVLVSAGSFSRLGFLYDRFLTIFAVALVVVFQPELRRALIRIGEAGLFRSSPSRIAATVDAIVEATTYLSRSSFGAIIVIERQIGMRGITEGGTPIGAALSAPLLQTIFFPGTALHDLAVVVKGGIITAAGVQLPLAMPEDMPDPALGSRHRAAIGLTKECDALVIVVSEESRSVRIAERGRLSPPLNAEELREQLTRRLNLSPSKEEASAQAKAEELAERDQLEADVPEEPAA